MSSIVGALTGSGGGGMDFKAKSADLLNPATTQQATDQYGNVVQGVNNQQNFLNALQGQNGIQNQSNVFNQMQGVANGTGPNPAQAQLAQATGANVANQAALMASQRGSNANVGMMARQAAMQGANTQQQAAGQAASMQAQQSLNALGQLGNMAGQQVGQQANATNAYTQGAQNAYQGVTGNINAQNNANVGMQSNVNTANAVVQGQVAKGQMDLLGNVTGAAGSAMMLADGGTVAPSGPRSAYAQMLMANGGTVPAMVSPGEKYLSPQQASQVASGGADAMSTGKTIPGTPKVAGAKNSYANDIVPATLQEGGIVIPRSITQGNDAQAKAMAFVKEHYKQSLKKG